MKIASLVLGIVSLVLALIPFCGFIAIIPAIVGLVLGIVDTAKRSKRNKELIAKGERKESQAMSITGLSLSGTAIAVTILWTLILMIIGVSDSKSYRYHYDLNDMFDTNYSCSERF